ncbi:hypothetical protein FJQ54_14170 [Sandaracinobacter neustonicus]|uniref:Antifreeze protein n=1 Tax=Sandaracinobacter neustonicus TaxID=1715348 RepID=A0A501XFV0_9SPHN|nr:hypothetical protein [Sandaracinobacter neustonicus]TPE59207.1 hypothetical protein FJQ54_14170 [Sandaracinobacter neustonicus]
MTAPATGSRRWILLLAAALLPTAPLAAQAQPAGAPKSLLPDDIAEPAAPQPGTVEGAVQMAPSAPTPLPGFEPLPTVAPPPPPPPEPEPTDPLAELAGPTAQPERAGPLSIGNGGYRADLFTGSDARFLTALLARLDRPLASRWGQILLQRALLTAADAPGPINPADWVSARARALVAIGSAADAHRLVSSIAVDRYTVPLYHAALLSSAAAGDPMAMCPLSPLARVLTESPDWALADAMCLAILGDDVGAASQFDQLRRKQQITAFDIGLAERVASATGAGRRGANPEWDEAASGLTAWRIGLASAAGLEIPANLLTAASPQMKAWYVRLPGPALESRAGFAADAAATGAISTAEINRILAAEADGLNPAAVGQSPGGRLRSANVAAALPDRIAAMKALWGLAPANSAAAYGWKVATAPAAARISPDAALSADAPALVSSLLAAGIVPIAERWWPVLASADSDDRAAAWGPLAAASPRVPVEGGLYNDWAKTVPAHRAQLLAAGLEGLGRGKVGPELAPLDNDWTRALDRAVAARHPGEVIVIATNALRGSWAEVHPDQLRRIARALVAIGHAPEARLIVAEAATRG